VTGAGISSHPGERGFHHQAMRYAGLQQFAERMLSFVLGGHGRNRREPGQDHPLWRQLVAAGQGGAVRGIGEPVWRGRSPAALGRASSSASTRASPGRRRGSGAPAGGHTC
jgi:hypothetical protein